MKNILQSTLAIVLALASAIIVILAVQAISTALFPWPEGLDMHDTGAVSAHIATLPMFAFVLVLLSYLLAVIDGTLIATWLAPNMPRAHSAAVFVLLAMAAAANVIAIAHPAWFIAATLAVYLAGFVVGDKIGYVLRNRTIST